MANFQDQLPNGAAVSRLWDDNVTELLALFQFTTDAKDFAEMKVEEDKRSKMESPRRYIVACSYTGRITVIGPAEDSNG